MLKQTGELLNRSFSFKWDFDAQQPHKEASYKKGSKKIFEAPIRQGVPGDQDPNPGKVLVNSGSRLCLRPP